MDQEVFQIRMMEYLSGEIGGKEKEAFEKYLSEHPEHKTAFDQFSKSWKQIDHLEIPEPSEEMDRQFYESLEAFQKTHRNTPNPLLERFKRFLDSLWTPQLAYGLALLILGLGIGFFINFQSPQMQEVVGNDSNAEVEEVREKLVLTLLEQPSANRRLQGISEADKIKKLDDTVIYALLQTLNNDPNVNVRLAAISSLTNYLENPVVREGLVQSIVAQESPIVQITLANLMVALQEKKSIEPFKKLIQEKEIDTTVKRKLEKSIQEII